MRNEKEIPSLNSKVKAAQSSFSAAPPEAVQACPFAHIPAEVEVLPEPAPVEARPKKLEQSKKKTFVEIMLVDMEGKPVPGVRYRIKLPDKDEPEEGVLNEHGQAGFYQIDPGTCKISFPDLDKDVWEPF